MRTAPARAAHPAVLAILDAWRAGRLELLTRVDQIAAFKEGPEPSSAAGYLPRRALGRRVNDCHGAAVVLARLRHRASAPDPADDDLLAMAAAADANFLVTGDTPLRALKRIGITSIVTPGRFINLIRHEDRRAGNL